MFRILGKIKIKEDSCFQTIQEKEKEGKGRNRNGNSGIKQLHVLVLHYKKKCRCTHLNKSSSHTYRSINLCFSCLYMYVYPCQSMNRHIKFGSFTVESLEFAVAQFLRPSCVTLPNESKTNKERVIFHIETKNQRTDESAIP